MTDPMEQAWRNHLIRRHGREIPDNKTPFRDALLNALGRIGDALEAHADRAQVGIIDDPVTAFLNGGGSTKKDDPMLKHLMPGCDPREIRPGELADPRLSDSGTPQSRNKPENPPIVTDSLSAAELDALPRGSMVGDGNGGVWVRWPLHWSGLRGAICLTSDELYARAPITLIHRAPGPDEIVIKRDERWHPGYLRLWADDARRGWRMTVGCIVDRVADALEADR